MTDAVGLAVEFITQGYVVIPGAVTGAELEGMQSAFERLASMHGKRHFVADEIVAAPELVGFIGHPGVMPVVEAFFAHHGHGPAIACLHLCRDIFDPAASPTASAGGVVADMLHCDVNAGSEHNLSYKTLNLSVASFLWLDDTYPDAGSLLQVPGSHHLAYEAADGSIVIPPIEFVKQHGGLDFVAAKAGDVVLQRGFNIHGTGPAPRHKRRQLRADYTPKALYNHIRLDGKTGLHQQFAPETRAMLPADRQRYFGDV